jgi:hypothetical protein
LPAAAYPQRWATAGRSSIQPIDVKLTPKRYGNRTRVRPQPASTRSLATSSIRLSTCGSWAPEIT